MPFCYAKNDQLLVPQTHLLGAKPLDQIGDFRPQGPGVWSPKNTRPIMWIFVSPQLNASIYIYRALSGFELD